MSKRIHVRPGKGQSKAGFVVGIIFCLIGVFIAIPIFGIFGVLWTAAAGYITFVHYRNKQIDSHVIEIDEDGEDATVTTHTGFQRHLYKTEGNFHRTDKPESESVEERLKKLTSLYMQSLITREEYEQKKKEILDEL